MHSICVPYRYLLIYCEVTGINGCLVCTSTVAHNVGGLNVWADLSCHYEHNVHGQTIIFLIQDLNALSCFSKV